MALLEIISLLIGLLDVAAFVGVLLKHWRLTISLLVAASLVVLIATLTDSAPYRWIIGFHLFVALMTVGLIWNFKRVE